MRALFTFATLALSCGLIVVIAMNARRVGKAVWLLASLPVIHILLSGIIFTMNNIPAASRMPMYEAFEMLDIGLTSIVSVLIVVACALLR